MAISPPKLSLAEVVAIGIGGMIGGGIFAVLGLAIAQAGHAVPITLGVGGAIALLTGISYAHLSLVFRGDGCEFPAADGAQLRRSADKHVLDCPLLCCRDCHRDRADTAARSAAPQARFTRPIITNRITAPMVALTMAAIMPPPM